jgi:hypothetical protein
MKNLNCEQTTEAQSPTLGAMLNQGSEAFATRLEEGRSFSWITRAPGVLLTARHSAEDAANGRRATLSLDFSGHLGPSCARLTRGLTTRYLAIEARGLKERAETEARSQASMIGSAGASR